nr:NB-ARC domain-containing protein [Adonisia turfae]
MSDSTVYRLFTGSEPISYQKARYICEYVWADWSEECWYEWLEVTEKAQQDSPQSDAAQESATAEKPYENIPRSGIVKFVGRGNDLQCLEQCLDQGDCPTVTAISGMGGVGKTELALQYARKHYRKGSYPGGVYWLQLRDKDLATQLLVFAPELGLTVPDSLNQEQKVRWCWRNWQPPEGRVLVVLDDVASYESVAPHLPSVFESRFQFLITTRLQHLGASIQQVPLDLLSPKAALDLLRSLIGPERIEPESEVAAELCKWLEYLPLGLELVGYYLREEGCSIATLLAELEKRRKRVLQHPALNNPDPTMTAKYGVEAAFDLTWERLDIDARFLGAYLSLFAEAPIRWELIVRPDEGNDKTYEALITARRKLIRFSLLKKVGQLFEFHPLIREFFAEKRDSDEFVIPPEQQITGSTSQILRLLGIPG